MDLQFFWNILARRKWLILAVMAITSIAAFFFVSRLDPVYKSDAQFTTGIIDFKGLTPDEDNFYLQKFSVEISFGNLMELMKSQKNLRQLSYRLLIHDLDESREKFIPFRTPEPEAFEDFNYSPEEKVELVKILKANASSLEFKIEDTRMQSLYNSFAKAYGYDVKGLKEYNLVIERINDTDRIRVECETENPELSYFIVENFTIDFLDYYDDLQQEEDDDQVKLLKEAVAEKSAAQLSKKAEIDSYKRGKNIVNLTSQQQALVTQRTEYELQRQTAFEKIGPLRASIADLDRQLAQIDRNSTGYDDEKMSENRALLNLNNRRDRLEEEYAASGFKDKKIATQIELYEKQIEATIKKIAKLEPLTEKDELERTQETFVQKKNDLEIELRQAVGAVQTLDKNIAELDQRGAGLVNSEALVNGLEAEYEILFDEYKALNEELSKKSVESKDVSYPVKLVEPAEIADEAEPDHQVLLSAFSGLLSGMLCTVLIFFLAFLDQSLSNPNQFEKFTNLVPLASVNKVNDKQMDIKNLYNSTSKDIRQENFKESLRNLRYQIESSGAQKFLFTSTNKGEGKTFLLVHLAHVLTLKNKKVLLIDANFKNNSLTQMSNQDLQQGLLNSRLLGENKLSDDFMTQSPNNSSFNLEGVDIIGNKGTSQSPSEVFAGKDFHNFIHDLGERYDYIFIESSAMNNYSDTKELVEYADKVVSVFSAESEIKHVDREAIGFLQGLGNRFMGAILNKVDLKNLN